MKMKYIAAVYESGVLIHAVGAIAEMDEAEAHRAMIRGWVVEAPEGAADSESSEEDEGGVDTNGDGVISPDEMKVAQLRAALTSKGVEFAANAKKAELVDLLKTALEG